MIGPLTCLLGATPKGVQTKKFFIGVEETKDGGTAPTNAIIGVTPVKQFSQAETQSIYADVHVPSDWVPNTDITIRACWSPVDGNAGDVVWDIDYNLFAPEMNEVLTAGITNLTVTDSTQNLQDEVLRSNIMTLDAAALTSEDIVSVQFFRDTTDGADTYGAAASLIRLEFEYLANN